jgi:hypothetical protein
MIDGAHLSADARKRLLFHRANEHQSANINVMRLCGVATRDSGTPTQAVLAA